MSTFLLIDVSNMMHRTKHTSSGDAETKAALAIHITLNSIRAAWRKFKADHVVFAMDGSSWRKAAYTGYKAQRALAKQALSLKERKDEETFLSIYDQFTEFLKNDTNSTVLQSTGVEADDFIARWIQVHPDDEHIIVSTDRDFYQLLAPNVKIYDGIKGWTISPTEVLDEDDKPAVVKKTVKRKDERGRTKTVVEKHPVPAPDPEYELFLKCIRGDSSDNVMSAYPGVREHGTKKKPGIREAFEDRHNKGFDWNNFMLQEWDKVVGHNDGEPITKRVRVIDEYKFNQMLVDLTMQPEEIKELMDSVIREAIAKPKIPQAGIRFIRYVGQAQLYNIGKNPTEYSNILSTTYPMNSKNKLLEDSISDC